MSFQIVRNIGADGVWAAGAVYIIGRQIGANGAWAPGAPFVEAPAPPGFKIIRLPSGPAGLDAEMDVALSWDGSYNASDIVAGATMGGGATWAGGYFTSRIKPQIAQTFGLYRNVATLFATATMDPATCGPGPKFVGTVTIIGGSVTVAGEDQIDAQAPAIADPSFTSGRITLIGGG